jgi:4-carboxymuconolactone decarboxylase
VRLAYPDFSNPTFAQKAVIEAVSSSPRGVTQGGPIGVWLHSPALAERAQALGTFCRFQSSVPTRLCELTILIVAAHWKADYEWAAHSEPALKAGVSRAIMDDLRHGWHPRFEDDDERAVFAFVKEMLCTRAVSKDTFHIAQTRFGDVFLIDLIGIIGYYAMVAMTLVAFEVPTKDGSVVFDAGTPERSDMTQEFVSIDEVGKREDERRAALIATDVAKLDAILPDEFNYVHSSGLVENKQTYIENIASHRIRYSRYVGSDEVYRVYGDVVLAHGTLDIDLDQGGNPGHRTFRYAAMWVKGGDGWRLAFWQNTVKAP